MFEEDVEREPLLREELDAIPVYPIIHLIRADIEHYIDTPLSFDVLMAPDLTYSLIQPLYDKYSRMRNMSIVFCFLLNRVHFLRDQNLSSIPLSQSRATLCEIMAIKLLRDWASSTLELATVMTTYWCIFAGAGPEVIAKVDESRGDVNVDERIGNAIEMAIIGQAKRFIKSDAFQKVIDCIWSGRVVYQAESGHSFLSDTYKRTPIHFYDPRKAPLLDHYRLKVPAIRAVLEYIEFLVLFIFYVLALEGNDLERINFVEWVFIVYAVGFTLDKVAAMQEHGMKVYSANLWNFFDIAFISIFVSYASFRGYGVHYDLEWSRTLGIDILALGACLMFPRLAFVTLSNNLMILSLRSMFYEFTLLMLVAGFCFCGFLYALFTLGKGSGHTYSPAQITWWMLDLYFGLDASGFDRASTFHPLFGPPLMVLYACLSNTLLLTVLVAILSNTFSAVSSDAAAESMFRRAVTTVEGVKADALFSYQPPMNILAFIVMWPLSYILTRRWFHKVNVFMIRVTQFPILLAIAIYERQKLLHETTTMQETLESMIEAAFETLPRKLRRLTIFDHLTGSIHEIDAVFELEEELAEEAQSRLISARASRKATMTSPPEAEQNGIESKKDQDSAPPDIVTSPPTEDNIPPASSRASQKSQNRPSLTPLQDTPPRTEDGASIGSPRRRRSSRRDRRPSTTVLIPPDSGLLFPGLPTAGASVSPLAQIFHPHVFDDADAVGSSSEDEGVSEFGFQPATANPVHFGPLTRRISMSANRHKRNKTTEVGTSTAAAARKRTQSTAAIPVLRPGLLAGFDGTSGGTPPVFASPQPMEDSASSPPSRVDFPTHQLEPQTVTEVENEEDVDGDGSVGPNTTAGGTLGFSSKRSNDHMEVLEKRQIRMERLLEKILSQLGERD